MDEKLVIPSDVDLQIIEDHPLAAIEGTDGTVLALGACWHGKRSIIANDRTENSAI